MNSSLRAYSLLKQSFSTVSLNENLKRMQSSVSKISSIEEAKSALRNASQRQGKEINLEDSDNLDSIKIKIQEIETELLSDIYKIQERQFYEVNRRGKFEAILYKIYSLIFIIFYLKLSIFFNRLQKSS